MEYYMISKTGDREINEDFAAVESQDQDFCCILADGLGGHDKGEVASRLVVENGIEIFKNRKPEDKLDKCISKCFQNGQDKLMALQKEKRDSSGMKTTMTVLMGFDGKIQWGHIGDSRLYYFQNGNLKLRTLDHSVPQLLVLSGEIKERDIRGHEDRNRLLRVMGAEWNSPQYELAEEIPQKSGMAFLLCSDGFWELIEEKKMIQALREASTPRQWIEQMEKEVLLNGKNKDMDNYTAVGVFIGANERRRHFWQFWN